MPTNPNKGSADTAVTEAQHWVVRLHSGMMSAGELAEFQDWRDRDPAHRAALASEMALWQAVPEALAQQRQPARASRITRRGMLRASAGGLALAGIGALAVPRLAAQWRDEYRTAPGESATVALGQDRWLFLDTFSAVERIETAVLPDDPALRLRQGQVELLAAGHPLRLIQRDWQITLQDGRAQCCLLPQGLVVTNLDAVLRLDHRDGDRLTLDPGWQSVLAPGQPTRPGPVDIARVAAWRRGELLFDAAPLAQVLRDIARYVPERVILTGAARSGDPVTASFATSDPYGAFQALSRTHGLRVRRLPQLAISIS